MTKNKIPKNKSKNEELATILKPLRNEAKMRYTLFKRLNKQKKMNKSLPFTTFTKT